MNTHLGIYSPWFQEIVIAMEGLGLNRAELLESHAFNGQLLNAWVEMGIVRRLWWKAYELSNDPLLGLKVGKKISLRAFNVVAPMLCHSPDLPTALLTIQKYQSLISQSGRFVITQADSDIQLTYKTSKSHIDTHFTQIDSVFAGSYKLIRSLLDEQFQLKQLTLTHKLAQTKKDYEDHFQCEVMLGQKKAGFVLQSAFQDINLTTADARIFELCQSLADDRLKHINNSEQLLNNLSEAIAAQHYRKATLEQVANQLNLSARTLQRKLQKQGINFQQAAEQVIVREASRLLENTQLPIFEIAEKLGYSNTSSFSRAFKTSTGNTPGKLRDATPSLYAGLDE